MVSLGYTAWQSKQIQERDNFQQICDQQSDTIFIIKANTAYLFNWDSVHSRPSQLKQDNGDTHTKHLNP